MKFKNPGKEKLVLDSKNPIIQDMVIATLRDEGVQVYEGTTGFDVKYPVLFWDGYSLTQITEPPSQSYKLLSLEGFLEQFISTDKTMRIGDYDAVFNDKEVKVGCQTIPYDIVKKLYEAMTEMRGS
jgi:hypothetical protein